VTARGAGRPSEHTPARPGWGCRVEGEPWPCPLAREKLREEYVESPTATSLYLHHQQRAYMDDNPDYILAGLHERFYAWVR
jgi:hypothetical protein